MIKIIATIRHSCNYYYSNEFMTRALTTRLRNDAKSEVNTPQHLPRTPVAVALTIYTLAFGVPMLTNSRRKFNIITTSSLANFDELLINTRDHNWYPFVAFVMHSAPTIRTVCFQGDVELLLRYTIIIREHEEDVLSNRRSFWSMKLSSNNTSSTYNLF